MTNMDNNITVDTGETRQDKPVLMRSDKIFLAVSAGIMSAAILTVLFFAFIANGAAPDSSLSAAQLLDLGEKYLLESDYERALVQFLKVIEIEPMNPRGYTGAAEAFVELGDIDGAIVVLSSSTQQIDDANISNMLDELIATYDADYPPVNITISGFSYNTGLETLDLSGMGLTSADIEPLKYMANLTELWLNGNQIDDISALSGLVNLEVLGISIDYITDMMPLTGLINLISLWLYSEQYDDAVTLTEEASLEDYGLSVEQIREILLISIQTNLTELYFNNQITQLPSDGNLPDILNRP